MLGTWLLWLTTTAAVLLAPALAGVLRVSRNPHKAAPHGLERRLRLVTGATLVGLAAVVVSALLGAGAVSAALVAGVLGGAVLAAAPSRGHWAVRGVLVGSLLAAVTVSGLLWLAYRAASSGPSLPELALLASLLLLAAVAAARLRAPVELWLDGRARLEEPVGHSTAPLATPPAGGMALHRRTTAAVAALVVPAGAVLALTGGGAPSELPTPASQAGSGRSAPPSVTDGSSASATDPGRRSDAPAATPAGTPADGPTMETTPGAVAPLVAPSSIPPAETGSPQATPSESPGSEEPGAEEPSPTESTSPSGVPTLIPVPTWPEDSKTPGYAKEKPNRPPDAPSPGGGRD